MVVDIIEMEMVLYWPLDECLMPVFIVQTINKTCNDYKHEIQQNVACLLMACNKELQAWQVKQRFEF